VQAAKKTSFAKNQNRSLLICVLSILLGLFALGIAELLLKSIALFTQFFYFQRFAITEVSPAENTLGWLGILVPVIGGLIVGLMARYGSMAIRGHGIPEAMENVLLKESRIPKKVLWLKPLSSAVSIGSGGPFGAEGPIIATGAALGSLVGQWITVSQTERKILLAAGAAAGMTCIFGTPFAAVLLAIELLLFEFSAQTFIPVAIAACTSGFLRIYFYSAEPFLNIPHIAPPSLPSSLVYAAFGIIFGVVSLGVTRSIYWIEDRFEHLPIHWMWWPALGGVAVGVIGVISPHTLGVGYSNITALLSGSLPLQAAVTLIVFKFISWAIALGSGTSGGTLAPILTIGAGIGSTLAMILHLWFPALPIDQTLCALVGMSALFAGCSRATLASVIFAVEITHSQNALVPLLLACGISHLVSMRFMKNSIMTEKIVRRGTVVPSNYFPESLLNPET
jgi:CIC family chloride channel protein